MNDMMLASIVPKSNQLNADDLIGSRTLTIKITAVSAATGEQPIRVDFEGDGGKPYYPCKSMRRVMVAVWTEDAKTYVGKSLTLYRDPDVLFGGMKVGGLRISHMSHIDKPMTMALTASKASRKPFTVQPLRVQQNAAAAAQETIPAASKPTVREWLDGLEKNLNAATGREDVFRLVSEQNVQSAFEKLKGANLDRLIQITADADKRFPAVLPPVTAPIDDEIMF